MARDYKYNTTVNIEPFIMGKFPLEEERFSIIIVSSSPDTVTKNLLQYILNSIPDEILIPATDDLSSIEKTLRSRYIPDEETKRHVGIIDISPQSIFRDMKVLCRESSPITASCVISTPCENMPSWLLRDHIFNIINPNMSLQPNEGWQKNYSHTIWLTDSIENLPQVLTTNSNYLFLTDNKHINDYMKKRYKTEFKTEKDDEIIVIGMTIVKDMTISNISKDKFK